VLLSAIFGPDLLLIVLFGGVVGFGCSIWAIIDIASHSEAAFAGAESSKVGWLVVIIAFTFFFGFGFLLAIYYLIGVRRQVIRAEQLMQSA
jgi:cbb3-type cytochrome oxidase subunit 1